jgi:uncharacterized protein YdhG (YjbR/CyaY superfamily)
LNGSLPPQSNTTERLTKPKTSKKAKANDKSQPGAKRAPKAGGPRTIDEYLSAVSEDKRVALTKLRETIRAVAPLAQECISYQIAAFRQNGMLVGFGATDKHCTFYLMSGTTVEAHKADLKGYDTSKGSIRFQPDKPLPSALVRKLVKARLAENKARRVKEVESKAK